MRTNIREADNHIGWEVQYFTIDGWKPIYEDIREAYVGTIDQAITRMSKFKSMWPRADFRVYEVVE